jgi:hypothetical protein
MKSGIPVITAVINKFLPVINGLRNYGTDRLAFVEMKQQKKLLLTVVADVSENCRMIEIRVS